MCYQSLRAKQAHGTMGFGSNKADCANGFVVVVKKTFD